MPFNEPKIRVLIYSKYALFREGLKAMLQGDAIQVIGEAATASQAHRLLERLRPDVWLLDLAGSGLDGSEFTRRIRAVDPEAQILVLSLQDNERLVADCMAAGATDYIRKGAQPEYLRGAIHRARRGAYYAA